MNSFVRVAVLISASVLGGTACAQTTWHVQANAAAPGVGTAAAPFPAIQAAIDAAVSGDDILVGPGTYFERIDFLGKNVAVTSVGGSAVTVIDADFQGPVVRFVSGEGPGARLTGFQLIDGYSDLGSVDVFPGGGIAVVDASPLIEDVRITGCFGVGGSQWTAGGIGCHGGAPVFRRCRIVGNLGGNGYFDGANGGVAGLGSAARFENCEIAGNTGGRGSYDCQGGYCLGGINGAGGVLWYVSPWAPGVPPATFVGCLITGNIGGSTGHAYCNPGMGGVGGNVRLINCTIMHNVGGDGGDGQFGVPGMSGALGGAAALSIENCIIRENFGGAGGTGSPAGQPGPGDVLPTSSPFISTIARSNFGGGAVHGGVGNFDEPFTHLNYRPAAPGRFVDGGDNSADAWPAFDLDGAPRIRHLSIDVGAFETDYSGYRGAVRLAADGVPFPALRVDGQDRTAVVGLAATSIITLAQPPGLGGPAAFALFGFIGEPGPGDHTELPPGVGEFRFAPALMNPANPLSFVVSDGLFGSPGFFLPTTAPATYVVPPLGIAGVIHLQAVIDDPTGPYACSATNAVRVAFGP